MTYGACQKFDDYPESFCLAKSSDLIHWDRFHDNPILHRGKVGEWDEGAIWFPTVYKYNDKYYLWYEGSGQDWALSLKRQSKHRKSVVIMIMVGMQK